MAVEHDPDVNAVGGRRTRHHRRAWLVVALLCLFMLINFADKVVVGLAGVDLIRDLGIDSQQFGVVQSSFFWLFACGSIVGGVLMGRVPARWLLAGAAALWVVSLLPIIWSASFGVLIAARLLLGFAEGPAAAMATSAVHSWFPADKRAVPTSIVTAGAGIGPLIAAPVLTAVIVNYSWHAAFAVLAVVGSLWVGAWLLLGREGPESADATARRDDDPADHVPVRVLLRTSTIIGILVLFFVSYCNVALKVSWMPMYLREGLGYDATAVGRLSTLPYLGTAVFLVLAGVASRMMTKRGVSNRLARGVFPIALVFLSGLSTIAFASMDRGPLQMVLIVLGASLASGGWGVAFTAVSDVVPPRRRGTVMGIIVAVYSVGGVIAPLALGGLVNGAPTPGAGYSSGFTMLGVLLVVGALIALPLLNPDRDRKALAAYVRGETSKSEVDVEDRARLK
ncbi:MFS transporter [Saccharopolyspora elongata]|uniref:MFS transporter n=1 Tax=Saccharopolyspora elongata TaxID=2530387 RepID=A0A4R4Z476_9PSEU|nr:MFS transporter [Saccharopolyspora elongata]TDD52803.1 MFS transporter [Saccharopolyspora elongata]